MFFGSVECHISDCNYDQLLIKLMQVKLNTTIFNMNLYNLYGEKKTFYSKYKIVRNNSNMYLFNSDVEFFFTQLLVTKL